MRKFLSVVAAGSLLAGCADAAAPTDRGFEGPGVEIKAAALNLVGVGDVIWDLQVLNGTGQVVWQQRASSNQYGDSAGSASYVGPCDADPASGNNVNTVKVWVVGVYSGNVGAAEIGTFESGAHTTVGAIWYDANTANGEVMPFQNPTSAGAAGSMLRTFTCVENQDTFVQFDVALMRPAQQGFFDIAVNFNNIFCSAKFDCAYEAPAAANSCTGNLCIAGTFHKDYPLVTACAADTDCVTRTNINLLHNASGRDRTFILGLACTAGADSSTGDTKTTELYLDDLELTCGAAGSRVPMYIDTDRVRDGNLCTAGFAGTCANIYTEPARTTASAAATTYLYQAAIYAGTELLTDGVGGPSYNKTYWNVALGVKAAAFAQATACNLVANATADDSQNTLDNVNNGLVAAGTVYPYIAFNVDFETCGAEPLMFGVSGAMVSTAYTTTGGAQMAFDHQSLP